MPHNQIKKLSTESGELQTGSRATLWWLGPTTLRGLVLAQAVTLLACGGASEDDALAPGCRELVAELARCYPGREDLKESLTSSFHVAGKTDTQVKALSTRCAAERTRTNRCR